MVNEFLPEGKNSLFFLISWATITAGSKNFILGKLFVSNGNRNGRCVLDSVATSILVEVNLLSRREVICFVQ
jgi:hypothetical protein